MHIYMHSWYTQKYTYTARACTDTSRTKLMSLLYVCVGGTLLQTCLVGAGERLHISAHFSPRLSALRSSKTC